MRLCCIPYTQTHLLISPVPGIAYTFREQHISHIRETLVETFKNIYKVREMHSSRFHLHYVCVGKKDLFFFTEIDIPFLTQDLKTNISMFEEKLRLEYKNKT